MDILTLVRDNQIFRFVAELENSEPKRKQEIEQIIDIITGEHNNGSGGGSNITQLYDNVDKYTYNKLWRRLQPEQQIEKIDEYVDNMKLTEEETIQMKNKIYNIHKSGKLKLELTYDTINGKITHINLGNNE